MARLLSAEERAVLEVVDREQRAFWSKDFEGFSACYLHAPSTERWGYTWFGGIYRRQGWDDLAQRSLKTMAAAPPATKAFASVPMRNVHVNVSGDMAWATYERHYDLIPELELRWPNGLHHNLRILERHDGEWKIALAANLDPGLGDGALVHVAGDGHILWKSPEAVRQLAESDEFVVRSDRLRLRDSRANLRLQEALRWAAGVDWGMIAFRGARPVLLDRAVGPMRVCWVMVDAGMILVALSDNRPPVERLSYAASFFRLSAAQVQLAGAIIEGLSLADFAQRTNVSLNTARTHLRRIYEKVGVRTQPALVRVLLFSHRAPLE